MKVAPKRQRNVKGTCQKTEERIAKTGKQENMEAGKHGNRKTLKQETKKGKPKKDNIKSTGPEFWGLGANTQHTLMKYKEMYKLRCQPCLFTSLLQCVISLGLLDTNVNVVKIKHKQKQKKGNIRSL